MLSVPVSAWAARVLRLCCPRCGGLDVRRMHRRGVVDRAWAAFGVRPYRYLDCDRHFHGWPSIRALSPQTGVRIPQ